MLPGAVLPEKDIYTPGYIEIYLLYRCPEISPPLSHRVSTEDSGLRSSTENRGTYRDLFSCLWTGVFISF